MRAPVASLDASGRLHVILSFFWSEGYRHQSGRSRENGCACFFFSSCWFLLGPIRRSDVRVDEAGPNRREARGRQEPGGLIRCRRLACFQPHLQHVGGSRFHAIAHDTRVASSVLKVEGRAGRERRVVRFHLLQEEPPAGEARDKQETIAGDFIRSTPNEQNLQARVFGIVFAVVI